MTYHCLEHWNNVLLPVLFYGIPVFFQFVLSWHCILVLTFLSCWAAVQDLGAQRWAYHQRNGMNTPLDLCLVEAICMASVGQHGLWSSTTFHDPGVSVWVEEMVIAWICNIYWIDKFINTLRLRQDGRHSADGIFELIFFNENVILNEISVRSLFLDVQLIISQHCFK